MFDVLTLKDIVFNEYKLLYGKRFLNGGMFRKSTLQQLLEWHKNLLCLPLLFQTKIVANFNF